MKLKTALFLLAAAVGVTAISAQAQQTTEWAGSVDVRYTTKYVFRGSKEAGQSAQAYAEFAPAYGQNGFYVGGWMNQPFASERNNELDLYGGYKYDLKGFQLDGGLTGYFYPQAQGNETDYSYELSLGVSREIIQNLGLSAYFYYDPRLEKSTFEGSAGYRIPLKIGKFDSSVDFSAFIGNSNGFNLQPDNNSPSKVRDTWSYYGATISSTMWFTKTLRGSIGIQYADTLNKAGGKDTSDNLYGYASVGVRW